MKTVENLDNNWLIEGSSKARLVSVTPKAEETIAYIARVTSKNQENPNIQGLLKYCVKHGHFSVFEQAGMTVEVVTPLAIAVQVLRHRSFKFQQFSGRYENQELMASHTSELPTCFDMFYVPECARLQDTSNRQNSLLPDKTVAGEMDDFMWEEMNFAYKSCLQSYKNLIERGIAKEVARFVLPQGVYTRLYITGDVRSFAHYIQVRDDEGVAQHEHCELARCIKLIFEREFPTIYEAFFSI